MAAITPMSSVRRTEGRFTDRALQKQQEVQMVQRPFPRYTAALTLVLVLALLGCGREVSRSTAPASSSIDAIRSLMPNSSANQLPEATIVTPTPSTVFSAFGPAPMRFEWTGADADGHLREYRYKVFGRKNPDFETVDDFIAFLSSNPEDVLDYYESVKWEGWERLQVKKDTQPSATYSALVRNELYVFVVVAIDNRGAHDATLTRERNVVQFSITPRAESPSLTFLGPFGQATVPSEAAAYVAVTSPVPAPFTVSWFATPQPGSVIKGYRSSILGAEPYYDPGLTQPTSLADTATVIPAPPPLTGLSPVNVEVEYDDGKRAFYTLMFEFGVATATGGSRASNIRR